MAGEHGEPTGVIEQRGVGASIGGVGEAGGVGGVGGVLETRPELEKRIATRVSAEDAVRLSALPYWEEGGVVLVAMVDPGDFAAADELGVLVGAPVRRVHVTREVFDGLLREAFGATAERVARELGAGEEDIEELAANLEAVDAADVQRMAEEPTLINLVNLIILEAVKARASDVHVEPFEKHVTVKYRIDGQLREQNSPPKRLQAAITSRIKIMAGMNIAERYVPQDGHITLRFEGRKIDIRVSTVPTIYGESVVLRLLDKEAISLDLGTLGMREQDRGSMERLIGLPHGMVLVTGPTGSGKTTTLYAALTRLFDPALKIITIEDPVEYELDGVNQIPVNPERGLTFASGLRSILRQDPDVVMVGEIRDAETAEIAVRAALTGHLIFSTLHTNDAASAVGRLLDMGVAPFLAASVLEGIVAQRLGRRICQHCKVEQPLDDATTHRLTEEERALLGGVGWRGRGCDRCEGRGTRGRVGYYELLMVNQRIRGSITQGRTSRPELLSMTDESHVSMRRDGLIKASQGLTMVSEVLRATQDSEMDEFPAVGVVGGEG